MTGEKTYRLDKFLWNVRIFKTRNLALEACRKHRVMIEEVQAKPSRHVNAGETIRVTKPPVTYTYNIIACPPGRVSAKSLPDYIEDLTTTEELNKLKQEDKFFIRRDKGSGRPTKKERRLIDKLRDH